MERILSKARSSKWTSEDALSSNGQNLLRRHHRRRREIEFDPERDVAFLPHHRDRWSNLVIPIDDKANITRSFFQRHGLSTQDFIYGKTVGKGTFGKVQIVYLSSSTTKKLRALNCPPLPHLCVKSMKKWDIVNINRGPDKKHGPHYDHTKHEVALLMKVNHPFLISMYGLTQDRQKIYMLLEYVCGGELFSLLSRRDRLPAGMARFYTAEVVLAFEYLHSNKIAYRDLKPENILIADDGHLKIADFGFAKRLIDRKTWTLCGTPEYIAPESIRAKGHGLGVDWWAVGILLYEMLTGEPPFQGDTVIEIYRRIQEGQLERPNDMDARAWDLIRRLLVRDLSKRLGCLKDGANGIKKHIFFYEIRWQDLLDKRYTAPWIPEKLNDSNLERYFDPYSDSEEDNKLIVREEQVNLFSSFLDMGLAE